MVKRRKELRDVKGNHASLEPPGPPRSNEVSKVRASIFGGALPHTSKLVRMNEVQVDHIELAPVGNHLLDEFAQGVQEHDRPERLGRGVGGFAGLGNHHRHTVLKVPRPMAPPEGRHLPASETHRGTRGQRQCV